MVDDEKKKMGEEPETTTLPTKPDRQKEDDDDDVVGCDANTVPTTTKQLIDQYLADKTLFCPSDDGESLVNFWTELGTTKYKPLAMAALKILKTPASSTVVEQLFSQLKFILTPTRNRTNSKTVDNIIRNERIFLIVFCCCFTLLIVNFC